MDDAYDFAAAADAPVETTSAPWLTSLAKAITSTLLAGLAVSVVAAVVLGASYSLEHPELRARCAALFIPFVALVALGGTSLAAAIRVGVALGDRLHRVARSMIVVLSSAALGFAAGYHPGRIAGDMFGRMPIPFIGGTPLAIAGATAFVLLALIVAPSARRAVLIAIVTLAAIDGIAVGITLVFVEPGPLIDWLRAHVDEVGHGPLGAIVGCLMGTFIAAHVGAAIVLGVDYKRSATSATISATAATSSVGSPA